MAKNQLLVEVIADNDNLRKTLADTERRLRGLERKLASTGKQGKGSMGPLAGSMGVVAGATLAASKAYSGLKSAVNTTTDLALSSSKLATITKMDATESAQWVLMARSRGVGAKQLNQSFIALSRGIQSATTGSKAQSQAFARLGVSQAALKRGNPAEVMRLVSDGLKNVKNGSERAALAQKLLGRGSQGLIGVLANGSKALGENLDLYKGNAEAINAVSGDTKELAANKRKLNNALDSIKITLGAAVIPILNQASKALVSFSNLSPGVKRLIVSLAGLAVAAVAVKKLKDAFMATRAALTALKVAMMTNPITAILTGIAIVAYLIITNWKSVKAFFAATWNWLKKAFHQGAQFIISMARKGFLGPVGWIITHWSKVKNFMSGLVGAIGRIGRKIGSALWGGIKNGANAVKTVVKGVVNTLLAGLEWMINKAIDGLNTLTSAARWAANKVGIDIPAVGHVSLGRMATGGIVNGARIAMIGEDGPEAVIPLSRKYRARGAALYAQAGAAMGMSGNTFNIYNAEGLDESALAARIGWNLKTRGIA